MGLRVFFFPFFLFDHGRVNHVATGVGDWLHCLPSSELVIGAAAAANQRLRTRRRPRGVVRGRLLRNTAPHSSAPSRRGERASYQFVACSSLETLCFCFFFSLSLSLSSLSDVSDGVFRDIV